MHIAEEVPNITAALCLATSPPERQARRRRRAGSAAKAKTLSRSRARVILRFLFGRRKLGKEVQRTRHEDRAVRSRERARKLDRVERVGDRLDAREVRLRARGELVRRERARVRRLRGDERVAHRRERAQHRVDVLAREDRGDDREAAVGQPAEQVADARDVVRAVPQLERALAAALEPAGNCQTPPPARIDALAEVRLGRRDGEAEVRAGEDVDARRAVGVNLWHRTLVQLDGAGAAGCRPTGGRGPRRPLLLADAERDAYLSAEPAQDARFVAMFAHVLEHTGGYSPEAARTAARTLLPDVLPYDPTRPVAYPGNGRALTDDVVNHFLDVLTNGQVTADKVGPHTDVLDAFPYLGPPHNATPMATGSGYGPAV